MNKDLWDAIYQWMEDQEAINKEVGAWLKRQEEANLELAVWMKEVQDRITRLERLKSEG